MDAWATLLAAVAGGLIAILGQYVAKRGESRTRNHELLLEQCSYLVASSQDYRNRLWEERELGLAGRVDGWDLAADRLASARLRILCDDKALLAALDELQYSGGQLGAYWRRGRIDLPELKQRYDRYKAAINGFIAASAALIRPRLGVR
jgi:hypothetical protein